MGLHETTVAEPHTPTEDELVGAWARGAQRWGRNTGTAEQEARRGIARIKAEAWAQGATVGAEHGMDAISLNPMHANPYEQDGETA